MWEVHRLCLSMLATRYLNDELVFPGLSCVLSESEFALSSSSVMLRELILVVLWTVDEEVFEI